MAAKFSKPSGKTLILIAAAVCVVIVGSAFYAAYLLAHKASQKALETPDQIATTVLPTTKQIRKITFKNVKTGETMELWADGTVNYFDKSGKLKKTARRGFAETQGKFHDLEKLLNAHKAIAGLDGYQLIIETEQDTIIVNPDDDGEGEEIVDDIHDYIDHTINPTPTPSFRPTPRPSSTPIPTFSPTPTPAASGSPSPTTPPPFKCSDYYQSGKPIKISNTICGPTPAP